MAHLYTRAWLVPATDSTPHTEVSERIGAQDSIGQYSRGIQALLDQYSSPFARPLHVKFVNEVSEKRTVEYDVYMIPGQ